jgi:hypothetical protein
MTTAGVEEPILTSCAPLIMAILNIPAACAGAVYSNQINKIKEPAIAKDRLINNSIGKKLINIFKIL